MPSILFVMKYPLHKRDNLQNKFDGQLTAARTLGWDAYHIGWDLQGMWLIGVETRVLLKRCRFSRMRGYDHTLVFIDLMAAVRSALRLMHVDVLYLRYMPTFAGAVRTMRALKAQDGKLVLEYPTYPPDDENKRFFLRRQVFRYTNRVLSQIHPMVDLYTLIGKPCETGMLDGRPAMNIVNGVDVNAFPLHTVRSQDDSIRLLALASMCGWHGYDRILTSLAAYTGDADVHIVFVGNDGDGSLSAWQQLTEALGLQERVTFQGALHGEALDRLIATCDVGIGSLGMYRYGLDTAMTLKLREYMSRGLPFISATSDPALPEDPAFSMTVPNSDAPIDMEAIVAFARRSKQAPDVPKRMREYAQAHMSWVGVLSRVLERVKP